MEKISGIYMITSPTGKIYIGKSINVIHRFNDYKNLQCKKQTKLYHSLMKHGYDNHKFEIIHECVREDLSAFEIYFIELYNTVNSEHGLNLTKGGDGGGIPSDETRAKMSASMIGNTKWVGRNHTAESKAKMSKAHKIIGISKEAREKMRISMTGKPSKTRGRKASEEAIRNMCAAQQNRPEISNETRIRMSIAQKGHATTDETRRNISAANKGRVAHNKGAKYSEEKKEQMRIKGVKTRLLRKQLNNLSLQCEDSHCS